MWWGGGGGLEKVYYESKFKIEKKNFVGVGVDGWTDEQAQTNLPL